MINYAMFLWCAVSMMTGLMQDQGGLHVFLWAWLMFLNAYEVAKEAR